VGASVQDRNKTEQESHLHDLPETEITKAHVKQSERQKHCLTDEGLMIYSTAIPPLAYIDIAALEGEHSSRQRIYFSLAAGLKVVTPKLKEMPAMSWDYKNNSARQQIMLLAIWDHHVV